MRKEREREIDIDIESPRQKQHKRILSYTSMLYYAMLRYTILY